MASRHRAGDGASLHITLFGRFSVRDPRRSDPIRISARVQQLLAYLLLHPGREFRRAHLAEILWGSRRQAQSRKHLRQALWALRAGIAEILPGRDLLRCQGEWVSARLDGGVHVDAHAFDEATRFVGPRLATPLPEDQAIALGEAADLYQSDLLEGWDQEWCAAPRAHLQRRFLLVMDALINHFEATSDDPRAMMCAARALEIDPAREGAHRAVMRLLVRAGDRSGAIRQYRDCEAAVEEELGVPPDASTKALYEEIVRGDDPRA
jgi:DNA-binding SARP family transcriptional activator